MWGLSPFMSARALCWPLLFILALAFGSGCATNAAGGSGGAGALPDGIYEISTSAPLDAGALVERLAAARFVVIGETHTALWHHEVQLLVWRALMSRRAAPVHLGMEMFQAPFQAPLTDYVAGRIDEQAMLAQTEYMERWRFDVALYAPLWRQARQANVALLALNAPKELTRAVAKGGIASLDEALKAQLPSQLETDHQGHRQWMRDIFAQHGGQLDEAMFERFYQAQVIWDETMAERAYTFMATRPAQEQLVIVAGAGHVLNRYGIPGRLERRLEGQDAKVLTLIPVTLEGDERFDGAALKKYQRERFADFIWVRRAPKADDGAVAAPAQHPSPHPKTTTP